ncbi:MAG TPA: c-type cytochrome [Caulobacteraceae bacterium]|jgi:cytochrome c2|nr:c-type cytochrome [Caulobacteraceae bacterium]
MLRLAPLLVLVGAVAALAACSPPSGEPITLIPGGDSDRGRAAIERIGCGACHTIPGVPGASGVAGPPLIGIGRRTFIAGTLANTPSNMERWLEAPQAVLPGNAMPNMEIDDHDARDVAAYLYTLR